MASPVLRQAVYSLSLSSSVLSGLRLTEPVIFPNFAPDAVEASRFLVFRWGVTAPGIGNVNRVDLGCWVYNREADYGPIAAALLEMRRLIPTLEGVRMSPTEAVLGIGYNGDSDDLYDDGYRAWTRYTSHTITASGS